MSPDLPVITEQSHVRQALRLVEGGEDDAHVGEVLGPLEVVGLHTGGLSLQCLPAPVLSWC